MSDAETPGLRRQSWAVIEEHYKRGVFRAVGVSNYEVRHLKVRVAVFLFILLPF